MNAQHEEEIEFSLNLGHNLCFFLWSPVLSKGVKSEMAQI